MDSSKGLGKADRARAALRLAVVAAAGLGLSSTAAAAALRQETVGGLSSTWVEYQKAAGKQGPQIKSHETIEVACRVRGFKVTDGNVWWYRIASKPWNDHYYVSADAFYNNGKTSGPLKGTPFFDPKVPVC